MMGIMLPPGRGKPRVCLRALLAGLCLWMTILATPAYAQAPALPHAFYGAVEVNGEPAPADTQVEARGEGVRTNIVGNPIVVAQVGRYGGPGAFDDKLIVQGDVQTGTPIEFFLNGVRAQCAEPGGEWLDSYPWNSGTVTELDLRVAAEPSPTTEPTSTTTQVPPTVELTSTPTATQVPPTVEPTATTTATKVPPTVEPTATTTATQVPPTVEPTATPTATQVPLTVEPTSTPTATQAPPTVEPTATPTATQVPPTSGPTAESTATQVPPTIEPTATLEPAAKTERASAAAQSTAAPTWEIPSATRIAPETSGGISRGWIFPIVLIVVLVAAVAFGRLIKTG